MHYMYSYMPHVCSSLTVMNNIIFYVYNCYYYVSALRQRNLIYVKHFVVHVFCDVLGGASFLPGGGVGDFILRALFTRCALLRFSRYARCAQYEKLATLAAPSEKLATLAAPSRTKFNYCSLRPV